MTEELNTFNKISDVWKDTILKKRKILQRIF